MFRRSIPLTISTNFKTTKTVAESGYFWKLVGWTNAYLEPSWTSKVKHASKIVHAFQPLTIFVKSFILDVQQGSEYVFKR